jgi:hypothetical protein
LLFADSDISFARDDWSNEILHALQHYAIVQPWSEAMDLDAHHQVISHKKSFAYCYTHGLPRHSSGTYYEPGAGKTYYWHPGYAIAMRRESFDQLGGLVDHCILGSGDFNMMYALIGEAESTIQRPLSDRYKSLILQWQERAERYIRRNVGYVSGTVLHHWHGPKTSRRYMDRWEILNETQFDPDVDLKRDWQGLWQLTDRSIVLRDRLRAYFAQRDEDSTGQDALWSETMLSK